MMDLDHNRYFILVGDEETWKVSLLHKLWGFTEKSKGSWNTSNVGDYVVFYVTSPVMKIIGYGRIKRKFIDSSEVWPDEKLFKRPIWKYRLEFKTIRIVEDWKKGLPRPRHIMLNVGRKPIDRAAFLDIIARLNGRNNKIMIMSS